MIGRRSLGALSLLLVVTNAAEARDFVRIVGSSTVFPFTARVTESYQSVTDYWTVVESTGTGGGFQSFCAGIGDDHPDITGASRAIKNDELDECENHGVFRITELKIGSDGIVVANNIKAAHTDFTRAELFQALAQKVEVDGKVVDNPYTRWSEINPNLPDIDIKVMGPPATSGTREAFQGLALAEGCKEFEAIAALEAEERKKVCTTMREDGPFVVMGEDDTLIIKELANDPESFGIFGFSYAHNNEDLIEANKIEGVAPSIESISDGSYELSRPLYIYVKNQNRPIASGLDELLTEYMSEEAIGPEGYLADLGLVPLPDFERRLMRGRAEVYSALIRGFGEEEVEDQQ